MHVVRWAKPPWARNTRDVGRAYGQRFLTATRMINKLLNSPVITTRCFQVGTCKLVPQYFTSFRLRCCYQKMLMETHFHIGVPIYNWFAVYGTPGEAVIFLFLFWSGGYWKNFSAYTWTAFKMDQKITRITFPLMQKPQKLLHRFTWQKLY